MIHTFASLYAISAGANQALRELLTEFSHRARTHARPLKRCGTSATRGLETATQVAKHRLFRARPLSGPAAVVHARHDGASREYADRFGRWRRR